MKISGGAWKLVLAALCIFAVFFNLLLGNTFPMIFWAACAFGLIIWYGCTYQDRKAEYDATRAQIAKSEEHLREMRQEISRMRETANPKPTPAPAKSANCEGGTVNIMAPRSIDGAPIKYTYEVPLENADHDVIYKTHRSGIVEYIVGESNDSAAIVLADGKPIGEVRERLDMLQDWVRRGDPYKIYLSSCSEDKTSVWLYFYRDRRKSIDGKEQTVVSLVGYKGEDAQIALIDVAPGDELKLLSDNDGNCNDIVSVEFDGITIGRLPKRAAEKFSATPSAEAFVECVDTDDEGNYKPTIRIYW